MSAVSDQAREQVLEFLDEHGLVLTPNNVAENLGYSAGYTRRVLKSLSEDGLASKKADAGDPFYGITDRGRAYLRGNLDADELE